MLAGHSTLDVTKIYVAPSEKELQSAVDRIEGFRYRVPELLSYAFSVYKVSPHILFYNVFPHRLSLSMGFPQARSADSSMTKKEVFNTPLR